MAKGAHSRGAAGKFKRALQNVSTITGPDGKIHEYITGPGNITPTGCDKKKTNYKGATGASYVGIRKLFSSAKTNQVQVATLIRCTSGPMVDAKGKPIYRFHWVQTKTRDRKGLLDALDYADAMGFSVDTFASRLHAFEDPVVMAVTWRVIEVYG